jgi:hypothetical protein
MINNFEHKYELTTYDKNILTIINECKKYDDTHVYKECNDSDVVMMREWLVILQKTEITDTDEDRKNVCDKNHARFRANMLKIVRIININNPHLEKHMIVNRRLTRGSSRIIYEVYEVGEIISSDKVDITYYSTPESACFGGSPMIFSNYSGKYISWSESGKKERENIYENNKLVKMTHY